MKTKRARFRKSAVINNSRWMAYATAGAATAIAGANSVEADIHYSGPINLSFDAASSSLQQQPFSLDNGAFINFGHYRTGSGTNGAALFFIGGASISAKFAGIIGSNTHFRYPSRLTFGQTITGRPFATNRGNIFATLAFGPGYTNSQFLAAGSGYIGFKFDGGAGVEYGWAHVNMDSGTPGNTFTLIDFAWADSGTPITVGQTAVPEPGSLGLLALGGAGLLAWRKRRMKAAAV